MRAQNRRLGLRVVAAGLLLAGAAFAVSPAAADDWKTCADSSSGDDAVIAACTRAIASGRYTAESLATLYTSRAIDYAAKRQLDRAGQDFDQAIRLDPRFAQAAGTDPVDVGDGRFIVCCRAIVNECRTHTSWRLRDTQGPVHEQCIETCMKNAKCH